MTKYTLFFIENAFRLSIVIIKIYYFMRSYEHLTLIIANCSFRKKESIYDFHNQVKKYTLFKKNKKIVADISCSRFLINLSSKISYQFSITIHLLKISNKNDMQESRGKREKSKSVHTVRHIIPNTAILFEGCSYKISHWQCSMG